MKSLNGILAQPNCELVDEPKHKQSSKQTDEDDSDQTDEIRNVGCDGRLQSGQEFTQAIGNRAACLGCDVRHRRFLILIIFYNIKIATVYSTWSFRRYR